MKNQEKHIALLQGIELLPIWKAVNSHGSMAIIEIGKPQLEIRKGHRIQKGEAKKSGDKNRRVYAAGQYSLHVWDCHWEVCEGKQYIGGTNSKEDVQKGLNYIEGRFIQKVELRPRDQKLVIGFEGGIRFRLKPFDHMDDQWILYKNKGKRWALYFDEFGELKKENTIETVVVL